MTGPFQPIGEMARWRTLVELFAATDRGETVTYKRLAEALGLDPEDDRKAIRAAVRQGMPTLSRDHARSLVAVRGVGYRVALPDEHVDIATGQQRKSGRALVRAKRHVDHVDLSSLDDGQRRLVMAAASVLGYQQAQIRRLDLRQADLERVVESITTRVDRTEAETAEKMARMERRIAELEK